MKYKPPCHLFYDHFLQFRGGGTKAPLGPLDLLLVIGKIWQLSCRIDRPLKQTLLTFILATFDVTAYTDTAPHHIITVEFVWTKFSLAWSTPHG